MGPEGPSGPPGPTGPTGPPSVTSIDYTWAIKTGNQSVTRSNTFQNIIFTSTPELNGWTYNSVTGNFTCNTSGKYSISYGVYMAATGGSRVGSVMGTKNDVEIIGSATTQDFQSSSITQVWVNFFIMNLNAFDVFALKFTGTSTSVTVKTPSAISGETPVSASLTITRIV
jgi:hypothetical protein